ncbi:MAG: PH domain-containing protein [Mycobacteriales bacterium]
MAVVASNPPAGVTLRLRLPRTALLAAFFLALCLTPLAFARPWLPVVYVLPVVVLAWILRAGTDVDADGLTVRALLRSRRVEWDGVTAIAPGRRGELSAVLRSGNRLRLPLARARHLQQIAVASGGQVPAVRADQ